jgi:histidine ammonia-lyase
VSETLLLSGRDLRLRDLVDFEARRPRVALAPDARARMQQSVVALARIVASGKPSYGVNTGFGAFANQRIPQEQIRALQYNLVRSHACGVGEPLPDHIVRRIMLLKANSLGVGCSGIRAEDVDTLLALLAADVLPRIPARGSVAASGDLAPLAHLTLALIGEGEATQQGRALQGAAVLEAAGRAPVELEAKEGLALLNGTQVTAALAIEGLLRAHGLLESALAIGALCVDGLAGSYSPFDARIHAVRGLGGQIRVAEQFRSLLTDSAIKRSHEDCDRVQDPYSVRCMPQVYGAVWDTLAHAAQVLERECNSVSDNPLVFGEEVVSGGNFHAEPLGFVADFLGIAVAELGSMSERRIDLLERKVNPSLNMFLTTRPGLESGFMIAHVTSAALASENKTLAHPASVDTIPTSAGQEDHVSMAAWAAHKLLQICDNVETILAIEALAAARAIDAQAPLATTPQLQRVHARIRDRVRYDPGDHRLDREIAAIARAIRAGELGALLPRRERIAVP